MLEKPNLPDAKIVDCLQINYGMQIVEITFLPLGADVNTAVYRAVADNSTPLFVKLRRGAFDEVAVTVPKLLRDQGIKQVIAPLANRSGQLWTLLEEYKVTLSPYIAGHDGWTLKLSDQNWIDFGRALKAFHNAALPPAITSRVQRETYAPHWRAIVQDFQAHIETEQFSDQAAHALASFLHDRRETVAALVNRAEHLAALLALETLDYILCHADIHVGNILIDEREQLFLVDWDTLILAPKERDLMFIGGGLGGDGHTPQQEETLFYQGYGRTEINPVALAYYRCERIVEDIAAYCRQLLLTDAGGEDRENSLQQVMSQFQPGAVVELANRSYQQLSNEMKLHP
ncbi:MAG: phosphotransferase [Anaerolineae bacterium]